MDFLVKSAAMGYSKTKLERILIKKKKLTDDFNGEGWWIPFLQRHPNLSLRCIDSLFLLRKKSSD